MPLMQGAVTAVTLGLTVVLLISGVSKLGRTDQTLQSMRDLGIWSPLRTRWAAVALPVGELTLGLGLLLTTSGVFTLVAASVTLLMLVFTFVVARVVVQHKAATCNCFGSLSSRPVGLRTVARNVTLALGAGLCAIVAHDGVVYSLWTFDLVSWLGFWVAVSLLLGMLLVGVLLARGFGNQRQSDRPATHPIDVAPTRDGSEWPIPDVEITSADGKVVRLASIVQTRPTLLLLLSTGCEPCAEVGAQIASWKRQLTPEVSLAGITSSTPAAFVEQFPDIGIPMFYGYRSLIVGSRIGGVPSALLLGTNGMIAAGPAEGSDEVTAMVAAIEQVVEASKSGAFGRDV